MGENLANTKRMKGLICRAMRQLICEKPFSKITVQDVLNCADIQRATFYRYFHDKYEVVETINRELSERIVVFHFAVFHDNLSDQIPVFSQFLTEHYQVLIQLIDLRVENIDLLRDIRAKYEEIYHAHYPEADDFEAFTGAEQFLTTFLWNVWHEISFDQMHKMRLADTKLRIIAHQYKVPFEDLKAFLAQYEQ